MYSIVFAPGLSFTKTSSLAICLKRCSHSGSWGSLVTWKKKKSIVKSLPFVRLTQEKTFSFMPKDGSPISPVSRSLHHLRLEGKFTTFWVSLLFFKWVLFMLYSQVFYLYVCICTMCIPLPREYRRRHQSSLELEWGMGLHHHVGWVLGTNPRSSPKATHAIRHPTNHLSSASLISFGRLLLAIGLHSIFSSKCTYSLTSRAVLSSNLNDSIACCPLPDVKQTLSKHKFGAVVNCFENRKYRIQCCDHAAYWCIRLTSLEFQCAFISPFYFCLPLSLGFASQKKMLCSRTKCFFSPFPHS